MFRDGGLGVRDQRRVLPAAGHPGAAVRLRHRPRDARHRRAGPARRGAVGHAGGPSGVHRGGRRRPQAPQAQGEGGPQARRHAGQPDPGPDLTGEIRRQLKPLGRQAEVARRAAVIQADLRDAKLRLLADDLLGTAHHARGRDRRRDGPARAAPRSTRLWRPSPRGPKASRPRTPRGTPRRRSGAGDLVPTVLPAGAAAGDDRAGGGAGPPPGRRAAEDRPGRDPDELEREAAAARPGGRAAPRPWRPSADGSPPPSSPEPQPTLRSRPRKRRVAAPAARRGRPP